MPVKKSNSESLDSRNAEEIKSDNYEQSSNVTKTSVPERIAPKKAQVSKAIFNDDDDIVSNLTDKPKPMSDQAKKSSLMEDLFGGFSIRSSVEASSRKSTLKLGTGLSSNLGKMESNSTNFNSHLNTTNLNSTNSMNMNPSKNENLTQSEPATRIGYSPTTTLSAPRESRRGRRPSGIIDPLGLLSTSQSEHVQKSEVK